jgi:GNAT superfamily N-acetyltransferase
MNNVHFIYGNDLELDRVIDLYHASMLGEGRPVNDREIMSNMLRHANLVVTAWEADLLIGIARTLTDFGYVGYLSDLAVRVAYQRQGVGIQLIQKTRDKMGPESMLVLLAAPKAVDYYPTIGFTKHNSAWVLHATDAFPVAANKAEAMKHLSLEVVFRKTACSDAGKLSCLRLANGPRVGV